jgi:hypothetical protein
MSSSPSNPGQPQRDDLSAGDADARPAESGVPVTPRSRPKHLFNLTLSGIEELDQFESEEQKQKVLGELGREAGSPSKFSLWLAVVILGVSVFAISRLTKWALRFVMLDSLVEDIIQFAVTFAGFFLALRWLHRWGARDDLRKKLLSLGIPVCMGCGYSLRGLTRSHERCPECGREIEEGVRKLMAEEK